MGPLIGLSDFLLVYLFFVLFCACRYYYLCYKLLKLRIEFIIEGDGILSSVEEETNTVRNVSAPECWVSSQWFCTLRLSVQCKPAPQKTRYLKFMSNIDFLCKTKEDILWLSCPDLILQRKMSPV